MQNTIIYKKEDWTRDYSLNIRKEPKCEYYTIVTLDDEVINELENNKDNVDTILSHYLI